MPHATFNWLSRCTPIWVFACVGVALSASGHASASPPESGEALVAYVIEKNQQARGKVKTALLAVAWEIDLASGRWKAGTGEAWIKGDHFRTRATVHQYQPALDRIEVRRSETLFNGNASYVYSPKDAGEIASVTFPVNRVHEFEHGGASEAKPHSLIAGQDVPLRIMDYGFTVRGHSLAKLSNCDGSCPVWSAEKTEDAAGNMLYKLVQRPTSAGTRRNVYFIDPHAGYLITRVVSYNSDEEVTSEITVEPTEAAEGVWMPWEVHDLRAGVSESSFTAEAIEVNIELDDSEFTIDALQWKESPIPVELVTTKADGTSESYMLKGNRSFAPLEPWQFSFPKQRRRISMLLDSRLLDVVMGQD